MLTYIEALDISSKSVLDLQKKIEKIISTEFSKTSFRL